MNIDDILSISGKPGLFKMVAQTRNGLLAEALSDGKRFPVSASRQVSSLKDIAIYTYSEEVPMSEVFEKMKRAADEHPLPEKKASDDELRTYFQAVLNDYDEERVYPSHIKKVVGWYAILDEHGLLNLEEDAKEEETTEATEASDQDEAKEGDTSERSEGEEKSE